MSYKPFVMAVYITDHPVGIISLNPVYKDGRRNEMIRIRNGEAA
jgi:hypothetical protein